VFLTPVDNSIRIDVSTSGTRIVLKFCEAKASLDLPRGDYCVLKGRSACPRYFDTVNITQQEPDSFLKSSNFGDMELCCSTRISDPIVFPLQPPFALVKKGEECETIANTSVTEVSLKLNLARPSSIIDFCYYVNNGECDQVCYHDNVAVTCDCYSGYSLINNTACLINYNYGSSDGDYKTSNLMNNSSSTPLFTTSRDYVVMTITLTIILVLGFTIGIILIRLNRLVCVLDCCSAPKNVNIGGSVRSVVRRYSSEREKPLPRARMSTQNFTRDSISGPHVGIVAMDLLNRPKTNASHMHDLPSTSNRAGSYYENTDSVGSMGQTESIYDSLDRRQHNRVVLQSSIQSAQYDEPDKDQSVQPLMLTGDQSDSQYYCEPDLEGDVPETPVPAYSPGIPSHSNGFALPPDPNSFPYNIPQTYQDPSTQFCHGTLGRKFSRAQSVHTPEGVLRAASVARIAPTPRVSAPWEQSELHKPVSVGYLN